MADGDFSRTRLQTEDEHYYQELSDYLSVLSNPTRLRILKLIEKKPLEIREIASEINLSYENTKRHLDRLVSTTIVKKEAGIGRETVKGALPVWKYSLYPGGFESIVRNLGLFGNLGLDIEGGEMSKKISDVRNEILRDFGGIPSLIILMPGDKREAFALIDSSIAIGRFDRSIYDVEKDETVWQIPASGTHGRGSIVFSSRFDTITRISKPHAKIQKKDDDWYYTDCGSTGGSYIGGEALLPDIPVLLKDGDVIIISRWPDEIKIVFSNQSKVQDS